MKTWPFQFNIILLLAALLAGCETGGKKKEFTAIELHLEAAPDDTGFNRAINVCRAQPVPVSVENSAFLDERELRRAAVVDADGGFAILLQFTPRGASILENTMRDNPGHRIAILAVFGESRWLAAPKLARPVTNGQLSFTPDATRDEAERIVRGLTNAIAGLNPQIQD